MLEKCGLGCTRENPCLECRNAKPCTIDCDRSCPWPHCDCHCHDWEKDEMTTLLCTPLAPCGSEWCADCWSGAIGCDKSFAPASTLVCRLAKGHPGSCAFTVPETRTQSTQPTATHTYYVARTGLFRCCKEYLMGLIGQAQKEGWPKYTNGFKTKCPTCKGWIRLQQDLFRFDGI